MLDLRELANGLPAITPPFGQYLAEAGAVCLESQGHQQGQVLAVQGEHTEQYPLHWPPVTDQMLRTLNDSEVATEHGAIGIAVLLVKKIVGYSVVQRSRKGTGFDYWLGEDADVLFQNKARLEISGIRIGDDKMIHSRMEKKLRQTEQSDVTGFPAYIVVVEFGRPLADVRRK